MRTGLLCACPLDQAASEPRSHVYRGQAHSNKELPKLSVKSTDLVKAHLIDQLLEDQGILGKEIDTPFPIVEGNGTGYDLAYRIGVATADEPMFVHHALAIGHGLGVPVHVLSALAVHGIKAEILRGWNRRIQPLCHGFRLTLHDLPDARTPLRRTSLQSLFSKRSIGLGRRLIQTQLNDR